MLTCSSECDKILLKGGGENINISERIKNCRKALNLSQAAFGQQIGVSRDSINNVENKRADVSDIVVKSICREFHVNECWLRTGEGEMFVRKTRNDELAEFFGQLSQEDDSFKKRLISALSRLDVNSWEALEKFANDLFTKDGEEQA